MFSSVSTVRSFYFSNNGRSGFAVATLGSEGVLVNFSRVSGVDHSGSTSPTSIERWVAFSNVFPSFAVSPQVDPFSSG